MAKRPPGRTQQTSSGRLTKAERREQARRERQELIRKAAIRRKRRRRGLILGSVLVVGGIAAWVVFAMGGGSSKPSLPGMLTSNAPWPANGDRALTRANDINLPREGTTYHVHALLQIYIHGKLIPVPQDVGLEGSTFAPLHTHDTSGIIHMESVRPFPFTLGDFFDVWGVRLTDRCIGSYCSNSNDFLAVYVNGKAQAASPRSIRLGQHEDVVLTFGTSSELPKPIPKTYSKSISSSCAPGC